MVNTQTHVNTHPRAYHKLYATSTALVLIDEAVFLLDRAKTDVQRDSELNALPRPADNLYSRPQNGAFL